ncbi:MAG: hypothetical protein LBR66_04050 [Candidatus Symbiothrix sp.]|nr:hypothetical protein [Candidatus Symbiothrix sp.]
MKRLILLTFFLTSGICSLPQETLINGCRITVYYSNDSSREFTPCGNVFVETNPRRRADLYVRVVADSTRATYKVFQCTDTPKKCGEWRFVNKRRDADFTIKYVAEFYDCSIFFTSNRASAGFF